MEYPEQEKFVHAGLTKALLSGLEMAFEGDETNQSYGWYNGLLFSLEPLSAAQAGQSITEGGSTIAAHADHALLTLRVVLAMLNNQRIEADWQSSWKLRQLSEAEWNQLKSELRQQYQATRALIQEKPFWRETELTQMIHHIAHTAYHASAIRQILRSAP
ncbi:hypothetical protein [Meiothermus hypogaeus]|uniref:DinB-like domain-containing protein n=2 Tax=Meiothermus hypogaeus TaxID=884155 RepID=A0A511R1K7_9DEIN|nr:hypothetical protein [Meiothermus hypogaeus]RIH75790.1 hypothetical protein Mhypo_02769 [Meiothermus hypogaeus]GEM83491.1 hypothetical protein MHY01S_16570 [Meiothermus hypogaeus NBRC 106114]